MSSKTILDSDSNGVNITEKLYSNWLSGDEELGRNIRWFIPVTIPDPSGQVRRDDPSRTSRRYLNSSLINIRF